MKPVLFFLGLLVVLALLYYTPAVPGTANVAAQPAVPAVLRADAERLAAMMAGDAAALGRVFSDELVFVHSDGRVESKAEYVKNLMAGDTAYADAKTSEVQTLKPAADVVVLIGAQEMRKRLGPAWSDIRLRFLSVWRNENGTWRMVAWQSARPTGNSVVPPKS
jgi:ketosteroid isomerase-like protein